MLFNCVPRDWEDPGGWPERALAQMATQAWTLSIVHDVGRYGGMRQLDRFLDTALDQGFEIVQDFPPDCVPIRDGLIVGSLDGLVCGDEPEPASKLSLAAAERVG